MAAAQYTWYKIFNKAEFEDTELISKKYTLDLENLGPKEVLVTLGNMVSMTYEGIFLPIQLGDQNPYSIDGMAVYLDEETDDVYLGFLIPEE